MAFPTLIEIASTIALLVGCCGIANLLSSALKLHPIPLPIEDPKRESSQAFFLVIAVFIVTAMLEAFRFIVYRPLFQLDERPPLTVDYYDVTFTALFYVPWGIFLFLAMRRTGQGFTSIGVVKTDWKRALAFGLSLSAAYFGIVGLFASSFSSGFTATSSSLAYGLLHNSVIGLSEELVWRGYIQIRLIAGYGSLKGLTGTSILFAFLHFPQRYFLYSGVILEALSSVLLVIAAGLLFGYVMLKSQRIIPPTVFHIAANWTALFWGISSF